MKLIKYDLSNSTVSQTPIMVGEVASQMLVSEVDAADIRITSVTFRDGARNRMHRHSCDQVLVIVEGRGIIATETECREVERGDVIVLPAGELHWHGALPGESMTHLSIVTPHETEMQEQDEPALLFPAGAAAR
jgi:quercetin dioxygenase-like cupin family protein